MPTQDKATEAIYGPYQHLSSVSGKGVRSHLIAAFNQWTQVEAETLKKITAIVELLHNASLLVDDIEDNSRLRRGLPVAHLIFGVAQTINSANYMYFKALQQCNELPSPEATVVFIGTL